MKFRNTLYLILLTAVLVVFTQGVGLADDKAGLIDEYLTYCSQNHLFNGSALVAEGGEVIFKKGYGQANMEWGIPNQPDTKFRIASVTKQFAAMLIVQLAAEKKLDLNGKISDYLPDYREDTGGRVTIHHLLTHSSGIPNFDREFWAEHSLLSHKKEEMVEMFCSRDLEFEPGSKYNYSNSGYYLLGVIVEKVAGKPFEEVLREKILEPLGMNDTGLDNNSIILEKRAYGYGFAGDRYTNARYLDMGNPFSAGGMYSTVEDMYLWDRALYTDKLLPKKRLKQVFEPHIATDTTNTSFYGYGWGIKKTALSGGEDSVMVTRHSGGINGFNTIIYRLVEDEHLIVLFNNTGGAPLNDICQGITSILYEREYELPKKSITPTLEKILAEKGIDAAVEKYHDMKANKSDEFKFDENALNGLGYSLLGRDKVDEAIAIFKLNIEEYPDAFNPYDSLGEGYMVKGERRLAIINYAKSLELNPDNFNAIEMLKKLMEMEE